MTFNRMQQDKNFKNRVINDTDNNYENLITEIKQELKLKEPRNLTLKSQYHSKQKATDISIVDKDKKEILEDIKLLSNSPKKQKNKGSMSKKSTNLQIKSIIQKHDSGSKSVANLQSLYGPGASTG